MFDTSEFGITYSPFSEAKWEETMKYDGNGKELPKFKCGLDLYTDATWATSVENSYSVSGMLITAFGTPVAWKSQRQSVRADSTCAAEYIAAADGIKWCSNMGHLQFYDWPSVPEGGIPPEIRILLDSTAAIQVSRSEEGKPRTRWLSLRWHRVADEKNKIYFVKSHQQKADVLTKPPKSEGIKGLFGLYGTEPLSCMQKRGVSTR